VDDGGSEGVYVTVNCKIVEAATIIFFFLTTIILYFPRHVLYAEDSSSKMLRFIAASDKKP